MRFLLKIESSYPPKQFDSLQWPDFRTEQGLLALRSFDGIAGDRRSGKNRKVGAVDLNLRGTRYMVACAWILGQIFVPLTGRPGPRLFGMSSEAPAGDLHIAQICIPLTVGDTTPLRRIECSSVCAAMASRRAC